MPWQGQPVLGVRAGQGAFLPRRTFTDIGRLSLGTRKMCTSQKLANNTNQDAFSWKSYLLNKY